MHRFKIVIPILIALLFSACQSSPGKPSLKQVLQQQKINTVTASKQNREAFMLQFLNTLGSSGATNIVSIKAHPGKPIIIDAESFAVNQPVDLVAVFNSQAFQDDWGDIFPPTTNGWDAFVATLRTIEKVAGNPVPWLAGSLSTAMRRGGVNFTGDGNSVATDRSSIDNSDNSNHSRNGLEVLPIDTSETPIGIGQQPEEEDEEECDIEFDDDCGFEFEDDEEEDEGATDLPPDQ